MSEHIRRYHLLLFLLFLLVGWGLNAGWAKEVLLSVNPLLPTRSEAEPEVVVPPEPTPPVDPDSIPAMREEITRLRNEITRLQQTLEVFMNKTVSDLQAENDRLRQEVRAVYKGPGVNLPNVPLPNRELLEGLVSGPRTASGTPPPSSPEAASANQAAPQKADVPGGVTYDVIAQWGRSPEEAAALSSNEKKASSLLGMVCVIPAGAQEENLVALARSLRQQCDLYDNINIEVFDDETAARAFNENKGANPQHRVLTISRHKASNRDLILLFKGEKTMEIPLKP